MNSKFYVHTEGNDDNSYKLAMQFAVELAKKDSSIKRIVLYIHTKNNTGWFERLFDSQMVKQLFSGYKFSDCPVPFKFETKITYKNAIYGNSSDIVICCGMDSDDLLKIDDYRSVKYMIAIPWLLNLSDKWIKTWNPDEISGNKVETKVSEPSEIVKLAMKNLTSTINNSTGISHPLDNDRAKTFIRALHKYEPELNADIVGAYLIRELNWQSKHAKDIETLINTLNNGKFFKGGETKGLQNYYKDWKKQLQ